MKSIKAIKVKYDNNNNRERQIQRAVKTINAVQNYFYLDLCPDMQIDICDGKMIDWETFRKDYKENDEYVIMITEKAFADNWFSHEEHQYSVISMDGWEDHFAPPSLKAYLIYEIAQAVLQFESDLNESMTFSFVHDAPSGCIFDFCLHKSDIKLGMIAGSVCPQCQSILKRFGVDDKALDAVERMLAFVRAEAIAKPIIINEDAAFIVMKYSENDENNNAYEYGIKTALEELGIDAVLAEYIAPNGPLLDKVRRNIETSRFVIVINDPNNLNVYFELGMAMGLKKDILLISEETLVPKLPSDLNNWEWLTYPKGNYLKLKENVVNYFKDKYHYK